MTQRIFVFFLTLAKRTHTQLPSGTRFFLFLGLVPLYSQPTQKGCPSFPPPVMDFLRAKCALRHSVGPGRGVAAKVKASLMNGNPALIDLATDGSLDAILACSF